MSDFIAPSFNLPMAWTVDLTYPMLLKMSENLEGIEISSTDKHMLRQLRRNRLLFVSNHPTGLEPTIAYHVANIMGTRFRYMTSRRIFDGGYGIVGKIIQNLGAFSIRGGGHDAQSTEAASSILSSKKGKLAMYPEGEPRSGQNDTLLKFQPNYFDPAFLSLKTARRTEPDADITILAAFIKYVCTGTDASIKASIHVTLKQMEEHFKIDPGNKNMLTRVLYIGRKILEDAEQFYNIEIKNGDGSIISYDDRIRNCMNMILDNVAVKLRITHYEKNTDAIDKLRTLSVIMENKILGIEDLDTSEITDQQLEWAQLECRKARDFLFIDPSYLTEYPSAERLFEWLSRFEKYLFGSSNLPMRKAVVRFAPALNLSEYLDIYNDTPIHALQNISAKIETSLDALRLESMKFSAPLFRNHE